MTLDMWQDTSLLTRLPRLPKTYLQNEAEGILFESRAPYHLQHLTYLNVFSRIKERLRNQ